MDQQQQRLHTAVREDDTAGVLGRKLCVHVDRDVVHQAVPASLPCALDMRQRRPLLLEPFDQQVR